MELNKIIETLSDMNILLTKLTVHISPESLENLYVKYKNLLNDFMASNNYNKLNLAQTDQTKVEAYINEKKYTDAKLLFGTIIAGVLLEMQTIAETV
ncbi:MAG: hypothetical protein WC716_08775 [Chitinophagaceae bacterium]|jgi:hypothetical protein